MMSTFTVNFYGEPVKLSQDGVRICKLKIRAVKHISAMSYTLPTLPYTTLPRVIITADNLQAPVKFTVHVLAANCQYLP